MTSRYLIPVLFLMVVGLVGMCSRGSGAEARAPSPSPATSVLLPVTLDEFVWGSVATEETVEGFPETTAGGYGPSTAPHELSVASPVLTESEVYALLAESPWPRHLWDRVVKVAYCESRFDPSVVGDHGLSLGLMQIRVPSWPRLARTFDLVDAGENLTAAWIVYLEWSRAYRVDGFNAWSCAA